MEPTVSHTGRDACLSPNSAPLVRWGTNAGALGVARVRLALGLVHPRVVLSLHVRKSEGQGGQEGREGQEVVAKEKKS